MWKKFACLMLVACFAVCHATPAETIDNQGISSALKLILSEAGDRRLILLGELHGTRQVPALVARLISAYSVQGPVLLGLEIDGSESAAMRRYLASDGGPEAQAFLPASPFWNVQGVQHDGRRNHEVLGLIEQVRRMRAQGRDVAILAYDDPGTGHASSQARDQAMAHSLRTAIAALPRGRLIVLSGNVHAMRKRPKDAPPEMQTPMGAYLGDLKPYVINITANDGEFWACTKTCGPVAVPHLGQHSGRDSDGPYDLQVVLSRFQIADLVGAKAAP